MTASEESRDLVDALARAAFAVQRALERSAAEHGSSPAQVHMLRALRDRAPTINALAQWMGLDKSSTSGLVDRAERRGLVRRVRSQLDRRSVRVRLTDQGGRFVAQVYEQFTGELQAILATLGPAEREALALLLERLAGD